MHVDDVKARLQNALHRHPKAVGAENPSVTPDPRLCRTPRRCVMALRNCATHANSPASRAPLSLPEGLQPALGNRTVSR